MAKKNTGNAGKAGMALAAEKKPIDAISPVANVPDDANENLAGPDVDAETETSSDEVSEVVIDRLELVRELPEIAADVEAVQVKGGIEHFKDVDRRTMNVVAYGGQLCKQASE